MKTLPELRKENFKEAQEKLKETTTKDNGILLAIHTYEELTQVINKIITQVRERLSYTAPTKAKMAEPQEILSLAQAPIVEDIGTEVSAQEKERLKDLVKVTQELQALQQREEKYLTELMQECCPKVQEKATTLIGARLIAQAGSLKELAQLPSSTIQLLGAEKALFRHLRTGAKAPKFGVLFAHPLVAEAPKKAKAARQLAAAIAIAAREDYFGTHH